MEVKTVTQALEKTYTPPFKLTILQVLENSKDVLSEDEMIYLVSEAAEHKRAKKREEEYREKLRNTPKEAPISAEMFLRMVIKKGEETIRGFALSESEIKIYELLSWYFTNDPRFEQAGENYSLQKGILLHGVIGCGKTTAMQLFSANPKASFALEPCKQVTYAYKKRGIEGIESYFRYVTSGRPDLTYGQREISFCFDDLGVEATTKNFGDEMNVMTEIISARYDLEIRSGVKTHITTNLKGQQIEEFYGLRVRSRMKEMYNLIEFPKDSVDKRK